MNSPFPSPDFITVNLPVVFFGDSLRYLAFLPASLAYSWAGFMTYPAIKGVPAMGILEVKPATGKWAGTTAGSLDGGFPWENAMLKFE